MADDFDGSLATGGVVTPSVNPTAVSGNIDEFADTDWFRMSLDAGTTYFFSMTNGTLPGGHLHLRNAPGSWLTGDEDGNGNPAITYTPTTSGTYYLDARASAYAMTGTYTIAAQAVPIDDYNGSTETSGSVGTSSTTGTPVNGLIASNPGAAADSDWLSMTLTAGTAYRFSLTNGSLPGADLHLRNAAGSWLKGDDDGVGNTEILFTPHTTGTYYLDARAHTYLGHGTYTIAADNLGPVDDFGGSLATSGVVTPGAPNVPGTPVSGAIQFGADTDWFSMSLTEGRSYRFLMTNGTLSGGHLHLRNAAGSWLAGDEDGVGNAEIVFTPTSSGTYYLDARASTFLGSGTYSITAGDTFFGQASQTASIAEPEPEIAAEAKGPSGFTAADLAALTAPSTIDLSERVVDSAVTPVSRPVSPFAEFFAAGDLPDEDRHRLEAATRWEQGFTQQKTAFDMLPV